MKLHYLLQSLTTAKLPACDISALSNDSRRLSAGCLFLAEQGIASHALDYLTDEQVKQVAAIAYQPPYDLSRFAQSQSDKWIAVEGLNTHISAIAKTFYAPHFSAPLIGVTGTNGKTSVTHFIAQLADYGVIGTMGYGNIEQLQALSHTTPDALAVQRILAELSTQFSGVAMEVSSHALALHRVNAVDFTVAVFMNLSQDHLDFHDDMADYYAAKSRLFAFDSVKAAVINTDDDAGYALAQQLQKTGKRVLAFGKDDRVQAFAEFAQITRVSLSHAGIQADIHYQLAEKTGAEKTDNRQLCAPVWGEFNVANVLAALLALFAGGYPVNDLLARARYLHGVKGRIEAIDLGENKTAIIDYWLRW
ncbi:MAG: hypothetical protein CSA45_01255 [Gammaproteobacteria bacterium]|nr:MAG: hypothetical protein CSA45_01255 [Gammaproteobacteria bacterium]